LPKTFGDKMIILSAILAASLLFYLAAALLKPEWFE
jgi:K+-transporting ATPase KdpF subunit